MNVHKTTVDAPDEIKPRFLDEEQMQRYSTDSAMDHYKNVVYYQQRKGGPHWFHGRTTRSFRNNYDKIDWRS
jgi:hypothetical protein